MNILCFTQHHFLIFSLFIGLFGLPVGVYGQELTIPSNTIGGRIFTYNHTPIDGVMVAFQSDLDKQSRVTKNGRFVFCSDQTIKKGYTVTPTLDIDPPQRRKYLGFNPDQPPHLKLRTLKYAL